MSSGTFVQIDDKFVNLSLVKEYTIGTTVLYLTMVDDTTYEIGVYGQWDIPIYNKVLGVGIIKLDNGEQRWTRQYR